MNYLKRIYIKYEKDGIWRIVSILLKKLGIKTTYSSFMHKKKFNLYKKIEKITKHKVINGYYKSLILSKNYNWNKDDVDLSPKLLGCYEEQVQEKIIYLKKKNNLKYLVVFGASEGFHALGLIKNKFFSKAFIFEKDDRSRKILINNIAIIRQPKKGTVALAILLLSMPVIFCRTKRLNPTGGVISAISIKRMINIPNQIRSKPAA